MSVEIEQQEQVDIEQQEEERNRQIRDEAYSEVDKQEDLPGDDKEEDFSFEDDEKKPEDDKGEPDGEEETEEADDKEPDNKDANSETLEVNLKQLAEKYNVSEEDAEKIVKQQKHYKNDPNELAKALLNSQRGYSKLEQEFKALKETQQQATAKEWTVDEVKQFINDKRYIIDGKCIMADDIISEYSRAHPKLAEDLDDDKVFELACREIMDATNKDIRKQKEVLPESARAKRAEMKSSIKDQVPEQYKDELLQLVDSLSDNDVVSDKTTLESLAVFVNGSHIEDIKKSEYERGLRDGREKAKIVTPPVGGGAGSSGKAGANVIKFSDEQSERMEKMFGSSTMSLQQKKIAYIVSNPDQFNESQVNWAKKKEKENFGG